METEDNESTENYYLSTLRTISHIRYFKKTIQFLVFIVALMLFGIKWALKTYGE